MLLSDYALLKVDSKEYEEIDKQFIFATEKRIMAIAA